MKSFCISFLFFLTGFFSLNAQSFKQWLDQSDQLLAEHVENGFVDYHQLQQEPDLLNELVNSLKDFDLKNLKGNELKAFWINAYNLLVIQSIVEAYPVQTPKAVRSFFEKKRHWVAGEKLSLNGIEKEKLLKAFGDGRLHYVLVCAAQGCPPILAKAYRPATLEQELDAAARRVLNDKTFVKVDAAKKKVHLSTLFKWYAADFLVEQKSLLDYINGYRTDKIEAGYKLSYTDYDWTLNDKNLVQGALNIVRYRAASLIATGRSELKLFNAVYTQKQFDGFEQLNSRGTYFSAFGQYLYGLNPKVNIGADIVFKSNLVNDLHNASPFKALRFRNFESLATFPCADENHNGDCLFGDTNLRDTLRNAEGDIMRTRGTSGLAHIGPKIKFNPVKRWPNISLQQTFYIPIQKKVDGQWVSFTQLFYDRSIGSKSQLFFEASLWAPVAPTFRLDPFFKVFYSYFPTQRLTLYTMASIPKEYGAGLKYLLHPNFEVEALYTYFLPINSFVGGTRPSTFNLGMRVLF